MSRDPLLYLDDIIEAGQAVLEYTADCSFDEFRNDRKTVDAVIRRFEIIGEAVKHLPDHWKDREPEVPWHAISGFRNILAHAYFQIDDEIVWATVQRSLRPLLEACERLRS